MGGGGSTTISKIDLSQLTKAAEERLKQLSTAKGGILFACEEMDLKALNSHLARSAVFKAARHSVASGGKPDLALSQIASHAVVVFFTSDATSTDFLNSIADETLLKQKQGIHARAKPNSIIPSKVMAYRWPSLLWEEVEALFAE